MCFLKGNWLSEAPSPNPGDHDADQPMEAHGPCWTLRGASKLLADAGVGGRSRVPHLLLNSWLEAFGAAGWPAQACYVTPSHRLPFSFTWGDSCLWPDHVAPNTTPGPSQRRESVLGAAVSMVCPIPLGPEQVPQQAYSHDGDKTQVTPSADYLKAAGQPGSPNWSPTHRNIYTLSSPSFPSRDF